MSKIKILQKIYGQKIIAVCRGIGPNEILPVVQALLRGGISIVEITADTPGAVIAVEKVVNEYKDSVVVGLGTVLEAGTALKGILAGAEFIVSPVYDQETVALTNKHGKVSIAGALTPTEIINSYQNGADLVKVFPANLGLEYFKALRGPLSNLPLVPSGGISEHNLKQYIEAGAAAVCVGGSLTDRRLLTEGNYQEITQRAATLVRAIQ